MPRHSVSPERQLVDATSDAAKDDGAADASVDPRGPLLVLAVTGNQLQPVLAGSFEAGAWTTTDIAAPNGLFSHGGGGITMTGADHGLVVLRGLSGIDDAGFYSAQWTAGVWPPLTRQGTGNYRYVSSPAPLTGKALVAGEIGSDTREIRFGQFAVASGSPTKPPGRGRPPTRIKTNAGYDIVYLTAGP